MKSRVKCDGTVMLGECRRRRNLPRGELLGGDGGTSCADGTEDPVELVLRVRVMAFPNGGRVNYRSYVWDK